MEWRCVRCSSDLWEDAGGLRRCARCMLLTDVPAVVVTVFIHCDACGHKEQVEDEEAAKMAVAAHVRGCRKAHKGVVRA
jgi:DNA-directed RNA polymerase subunit RPC12/RpoP